MENDYNISSPPKMGTPESGKWAFDVFETSRQWRDDELNMPQKWRDNHKLYRGDHWGTSKQKNSLTIGLFFSNINRTTANITANNPIAEAVDLDGNNGELAKKATARLKKLWLDTKQQARLRTSTLNSEIYGITWEKSVWDGKNREPKTIICDPFAIFPYPGYYENMATDCPAICHATAEDPKAIQKKYGTTEDIEPSDTYSLLGGEREDLTKTSSFGTTATTTVVGGGTISTPHGGTQKYRYEKALIIEVWVRDEAVKGGIRVITITNNGDLVLADEVNPNINWEMDEKAVSTNYMYTRLPLNKNNSYIDSTSVFGFSAAEQTGPLNVAVDNLMSAYYDAVIKSMKPILVVSKTFGLKRSHLNNKANLVLIGDTESGAKSLRFVSPPPPPSSIMEAMHQIIALHDRVYAIEDIDRGDAPGGVTAGKAIIAMQERNAVLIQTKIDGMDMLVSERGKYAIAQWQMHGHKSEPIEVNGEQKVFRGDTMAGSNFNYVVESGSTVAKTSLQVQEQSVALAKDGFIDQTALLENLNFPDYSQIIERMAEDRLGQAMEVMVQAGLPEEMAQQLMVLLQEPQGGSGHGQQETQPAQVTQ